MESNNKVDSEHWNDYWSQGHKTSFGSAFTNGYEGIIKNIWLACFNDFLPNTHVLDLCTGNASLLRLAKSSPKEMSDINFTGVDYAQIVTNDGFSDLDNIDLKFGVDIEELPFSDQSFNYVISNFGIEYSELSRSIAEASRVLASGGELIFVSHCHDSILISSNRQELEMLKKMFQPANVLDNLTELIDALASREMNKAQTPPAQKKLFNEACEKAERVRPQLNESISAIANDFSQAFKESDFLGFLKYLLSAQSGNKQQTLNLFKTDLHNHKARLTAMVNAALTEEQLGTLKELLNNNQLNQFNIINVANEDGKIACKITAIKS